MRILTIRRIFALTVIGAAYVHGKRGGVLSLASISETLNYLWSSSAERLGIASRTKHPGDERTASASASTSQGSPSSPNGIYGDRMRRPHNG